MRVLCFPSFHFSASSASRSRHWKSYLNPPFPHSLFPPSNAHIHNTNKHKQFKVKCRKLGITRWPSRRGNKPASYVDTAAAAAAAKPNAKSRRKGGGARNAGVGAAGGGGGGGGGEPSGSDGDESERGAAHAPAPLSPVLFPRPGSASLQSHCNNLALLRRVPLLHAPAPLICCAWLRPPTPGPASEDADGEDQQPPPGGEQSSGATATSPKRSGRAGGRKTQPPQRSRVRGDEQEEEEEEEAPKRARGAYGAVRGGPRDGTEGDARKSGGGGGAGKGGGGGGGGGKGAGAKARGLTRPSL